MWTRDGASLAVQVSGCTLDVAWYASQVWHVMSFVTQASRSLHSFFAIMMHQGVKVRCKDLFVYHHRPLSKVVEALTPRGPYALTKGAHGKGEHMTTFSPTDEAYGISVVRAIHHDSPCSPRSLQAKGGMRT